MHFRTLGSIMRSVERDPGGVRVAQLPASQGVILHEIFICRVLVQRWARTGGPVAAVGRWGESPSERGVA
jgi:hypothetical protein